MHTQPKPTVLYVDDEPGNLLVFEAGFRKWLNVRTAESASRGLEVLDREEVAVVMSDQRMPHVTGAEFLSEVRRRHPRSIRMMVTAYTDYEGAVAAINDGQVSRFVTKPWNPKELLAAILDAAELYSTTQENLELTRKLVEQDKLAAVGKMTAGLVHDLANLGAALGIVDDIREDWGSGVDLTEELETLRAGARRFSVLVESLRVTASGDGELELDRAKCDLNDVVRESVDICRMFPKLRNARSITFHQNGTPILAFVDGPKIGQIVVNLVKNAAEASPVGKVEIEVSLTSTSDDALLVVKDNGPGVPSEDLEKIFSGFYSTKGDSGTGLGLLTSKKIAVAHGGHLSLENLSEGGCRFTAVLPLGGSPENLGPEY